MPSLHPDTADGVSEGSFDPQLLARHCATVSLAPGDVLREKGQHYKDLYLIAEGRVEVWLGGRGKGSPIELGPGTPVGEIGFLRGSRATADVVAKTAARAIVIDDATLWRLEAQLELAVPLLRFLARVSEQRLAANSAGVEASMDKNNRAVVDVLLCRNEEMLHDAMRLRYSVYCEELGRSSPYADHEKKIIRDQLDEGGHTFVAVEKGEPIATIRGNFGWNGGLGILEELYGMNRSQQHPARTAICTKFIVKESKRTGVAAMHLIIAVARFGMRHNVLECYIDCIEKLKPQYESVGFRTAGPAFFHYENGPSWPMMLDVAQHGERLRRASSRM